MMTMAMVQPVEPILLWSCVLSLDWRDGKERIGEEEEMEVFAEHP